MNNKRDAGNSILNTLSKTTFAIFSAWRDQQVPAYNSSFEWFIQSYDCKQVPVGPLDTEKMAEVALLNVFRIGFSASLLGLSLSNLWKVAFPVKG